MRLLATDPALQLPMETLALQSNRILFLDHHTQVFVWSGRDVVRERIVLRFLSVIFVVQAGKEFDVFREACRDKALQAAAMRVPSPQILIFKANACIH